MQTLKSIALLLGTVFCGALAGAQKIIDITNADARDVVGQEQLAGIVGGQIIEPVKFVRLVQGSPYFVDDWSPGTLMTTTPIRAVTLNSNEGICTFVPGAPWKDVDNALDGAWLELLVNDNVSLLRQIRKKLNEEIPYGGSTAEQTITDFDFYYVQLKGRFVRLKGWSDLAGLFTDKRQQIDEYIRMNHLKGRSFKEYTQVVTYYNSLLNAQKVTKA